MVLCYLCFVAWTTLIADRWLLIANTTMHRVLGILLLLLGLTMFGTVGLRVITDKPWLECLYMAVITLTTVGSRDVAQNNAGMAFVIVYLICGLGIFTYSAFQLGQFVVNARLRSMWETRRMEKAIGKLSDHYIVCGNGRMGRTICAYLHQRGRPFVVIDNNEEHLLPLCAEHGWLYLLGDATNDDMLLKAGIERAQALASSLPTDADNLYVVLAARMLAPNLQIVVRANEERAIEKLQRAGGNRVISPLVSSAEKMARFMITPSVEDFLEIADARGTELELADVQILPGSPYSGKRLADTDLRDRGVMVIGIRRANGERLMPPSGEAVIETGDCLFTFGSAEAVNAVIVESLPN